MFVRALAPAALFLLAFAIRVLPWSSVFFGERVIPYGNDAYYHLRRIRHALANFPETLHRDPYINFPHGGEPIWSPAFDLVAAALAKLWVEPSGRGLEAGLVFLPPLLGALAVVLLYWIARSHFGARIAIGAGLVLALLPAHFNYSRIGFIDHHAAVSLVSVALLGVGLQWMRCRPRLLGSLGVGLLLAAALLLWPGSLLHVGLLQLGLLAFVLTRGDAGDARDHAMHWAGANAIAAACVVPFCWGNEWALWGSYSPAVLTRFQPSFFGALAIVGVLIAVVSQLGSRHTAHARGSLVVAIIWGALLGGVALFPDLVDAFVEGLRQAWRWFGKAESFQAQVRESRPLFAEAGRIEVRTAATQLSGFIILAPVAAVWAWLHGGCRGRLLALWLVGLCAAAAMQARFVNSAAPALALAAAWSIASFVRDRDSEGTGRARIFGTGILCAALLAPAILFYAPYLRSATSSGPPAPAQMRKLMLTRIAEWIQANTPDTSGYLEADARPEYGVLSSWSDGHLLKYVARRPTLADNFGDDVGDEGMEAVRRYYTTSKEEAHRILEASRVRFVVFEARPEPHRNSFGPASMLSRLYFFDGEAGTRSVARREGVLEEVSTPVEAQTRHRLRFETRPKPWQNHRYPGFKVYEFVRGAVIEGRADPGVTVEAGLTVYTQTGRTFRYRANTTATPDGRYVLRVPYATESTSVGVRTDPVFQLRGGAEQRGELAVAERDVMEGRRLAGPDLRTPVSLSE